MKMIQTIKGMLLTLCCMMCMTGCSQPSSSVGIIGGADGPTAIFLTTSPDAGSFLVGTVLGVGVALVILWWIRRRKK